MTGPAIRWCCSAAVMDRATATRRGGFRSVERRTGTRSRSGTPTWSAITPAGPGPGARSSHSVAYDPYLHRMLVFGGTNPSYLNDTWALSLTGTPAWSAVPGASPPLAREEQSTMFDLARNRLVMFGGYGSGGTSS